jgi:hypothetical protein
MTNALTTTPSAGDNIADVMKEFRKALRDLGKSEGEGAAARPAAGMRLIIAAKEGLIDERDAEAMYAEYCAGIASAGKRNPLVVTDNGSEKAQISKFRAFIKAGGLLSVDMEEVAGRANALMQEHRSAGTKVESPFQGLYNVCIEQVRNPDDALTDDQILARILKKQAGDKGEIEKLIAAYKTLHKINADFPREETASAVENLAAAISEAGGEVPPMTKEEKELAAFMVKARAMGLTHAPLMLPAE